MSTTIYDEKSNTLKIIKDEDFKKARGFIVTVVDSEEELIELQNGKKDKIQLSPVLAENEEMAIEVVKQNGKIPLNVVNYEFLKLQTTLIEDLAKKEGVNLIELNLFNIED